MEESSHEGEGVEEEGKEEGNEQQEEAQPRDGARVTRSGRVAKRMLFTEEDEDRGSGLRSTTLEAK